MIVNQRIEITDAQRNALARAITPSRPKRLASRTEVKDFVDGCIAALDQNAQPKPETRNLVAPIRANGRMSLNDWIARARSEDHETLRNRSDGFVIGWCKVKYREEMRG